MDCKDCKTSKNKGESLSTLEIMSALYERTIKRLWIVLIIAIVALFVSNALWIGFVSQYDFESYEYSQDGEGINIIGESNEVNYGTETQSGQKN